MPLNTMQLAKFTAGAVEKYASAIQQLQVTGEAESGKVKVVLRGDYEVREVRLSPEIIASFRADQIGALVTSAYTRAKQRLEEETFKLIQRLAKEDGVDLSSLSS